MVRRRDASRINENGPRISPRAVPIVLAVSGADLRGRAGVRTGRVFGLQSRQDRLLAGAVGHSGLGEFIADLVDRIGDMRSGHLGHGHGALGRGFPDGGLVGGHVVAPMADNQDNDPTKMTCQSSFGSKRFPFDKFSRAGRYCKFQDTCSPDTFFPCRGII